MLGGLGNHERSIVDRRRKRRVYDVWRVPWRAMRGWNSEGEKVTFSNVQWVIARLLNVCSLAGLLCAFGCVMMAHIRFIESNPVDNFWSEARIGFSYLAFAAVGALMSIALSLNGAKP